MVVLKPNVVRGGRAIGLGNNLYLMKGRTHSEGGIDIGKNPETGLEVERGEVVQILGGTNSVSSKGTNSVSPQGIRVFSAQPILGGISPAQYILGGANPNQVFNAQEQWKKINRINDDGTKKAEFGKKIYKKRYNVSLIDDIPEYQAPLNYDEIKRRQEFMESEFDSKAYNKNSGAKGRFQIRENALQDYIRAGGEEGDLFDSDYNEKVRDWIMEDLSKSSMIIAGNPTDSVKMAKQLAAYNWGRGNLSKFLQKQKAAGIDIYRDMGWIDSLPKETRDYVNFSLRNQDINDAKNNERYNSLIKRYGGRSRKKMFSNITKQIKQIAKQEENRNTPLPIRGEKPITHLGYDIASYAPIVGDAIQLGEGISDIKNRNYLAGAINLGLLALPNAIEKPLKYVKNFYKSRKYLKGSEKYIEKLYETEQNIAKIEDIESHLLYNGASDNKGDIVSLGYFDDYDLDLRKIKRKGNTIVAKNPNNTIYAENEFSKEDAINRLNDLVKDQNRTKTFDFMKKAKEDYEWLKSGRKVSLITDESLSIDSYPLLEAFAERKARGGFGEIKPVIDANGSYRMIKLNRYGKYRSKKDLDKAIDRLREHTGDKNIPGRIGIGNHLNYVPAFEFYKYKYGGIHIKPSKRGTFTAAAKKHGMSVQGFASKVLANKGKYSSAMVKKANFARNASKWKHKEFGGDMDFNYWITKDNIYKLGGRKKAPLGLADYLYIDDLGNNLGISSQSQSILRNRLNNATKQSLIVQTPVIDKKEAIRSIASNQKDSLGISGLSKGIVGQYLANGVQAGINIAGNIGSYLINRDAIRRMRGPAAPLPLRAETLPTRVSTAAQEAALRENVAKQENLLADNLSSSRSRLNATNQIRNQGIGLYNQLQDRKGEIERELITRDKLNRQGITNQNIAQVNQWRNAVRDFENKRIDLNSENTIQHLVQGPADAIAGERGFFDNLASNDRYRMTAFLEAIKNPDALKAMNSDEIKQLARRFGVRTSWLRSIGINI